MNSDLEGAIKTRFRLQQVLEKVRLGLTNKQIAAELNLSPYTVRDYIALLLRKGNVRTRHQL